MSIDTTFLRRCIASLERAVEGIERQEDHGDVMYDIGARSKGDAS